VAAIRTANSTLSVKFAVNLYLKCCDFPMFRPNAIFFLHFQAYFFQLYRTMYVWFILYSPGLWVRCDIARSPNLHLYWRRRFLKDRGDIASKGVGRVFSPHPTSEPGSAVSSTSRIWGVNIGRPKTDLYSVVVLPLP